MKLRYFTLLALCLLLGCNSPRKISCLGPSAEYCRVSFSYLASNPEIFVGTHILVSGVAIRDADGAYVFSTKEDASYRLYESSLLIANTEDYAEDLRLLDGKRALFGGVVIDRGKARSWLKIRLTRVPMETPINVENEDITPVPEPPPILR